MPGSCVKAENTSLGKMCLLATWIPVGDLSVVAKHLMIFFGSDVPSKAILPVLIHQEKITIVSRPRLLTLLSYPARQVPPFGANHSQHSNYHSTW